MFFLNYQGYSLLGGAKKGSGRFDASWGLQIRAAILEEMLQAKLLITQVYVKMLFNTQSVRDRPNSLLPLTYLCKLQWIISIFQIFLVVFLKKKWNLLAGKIYKVKVKSRNQKRDWAR